MRLSLSRALAGLSTRHPRAVVLAAMASALFCLLTALQGLSFTVERTDMLAPNHPVQRNWRAYRQEFGNLSDYVVMVKGDPEKARLAVEDLGQRLKAEPQTFSNVLYRFDLPDLLKSSLYYISLPSLHALEEQLERGHQLLAPLSARNGLEALLRSLARPSSARQVAGRLGPSLPIMNKVLESLVVCLESRGEWSAPSFSTEITSDLPDLQELGIKPGQKSFYMTVDGGHAYVLLLSARDSSGNYATSLFTIARLRALAEQVRRQHFDVEVMVSGEPVINADETQMALRDALRASLYAFALVGLLLMVVFRAVRKPAAVMLSMLVGICWTSALAAWTLGEINLLTINYVTMLVGLGMSFGIHILYRFQLERSIGLEPAQAIRSTLGMERGNFVGALSTAVAFWALYFTSFRAAGQLGLVTGSGMLLCYLSNVTTLPSLLMLLDQGRQEFCPHWRWMSLTNSWILARRKWVLLGSLIVSLYSLSWVTRIPFDYNLMNIQADNAPALSVERYLQRYQFSALYGVLIADNLEEARQLSRRLEIQPTVGRVASVTSFEPRSVEEKRPVVERLIELGQGLELPSFPPIRTGEQLENLYAAYLAARRQTKVALKVWRTSPLRQEADRFEALLNRLDAALDADNPGPMQDAMKAFERHEIGQVTLELALLKQQSGQPPQVLPSLPPALVSRVVSPRGRISLRVFPRENCWERDALGRFVKNLRHIDRNATGYAVLVYYYLEDMRKAYIQSGRNALVVIFVLLIFHFRSLSTAMLAMFPKLLGVLWMIGAMGWLGVGFNPINFLSLPLTLGIGLIFGLHVLEARHHCLFRDSTGPAIVLSGLATMIGFATVLTAEHKGVASFGLLMVLGVGANLLSSVITLPALLKSEPGLLEPE
ncbi:MAG: MMPL family transporter [Candidatus Eremiobacteraeota bacterium]|nr:MMPL family transporter [Candidatus Eremiobacteraeota bacterium]MCW5866255.1 MMPL family transporter [Candidatus Eremiobacteraeota bacterium]